MRNGTRCVRAALALAVLAGLTAAGRGQENGKDPAGSCAVCHGQEATRHAAGVHAGSGVTCTTCHGGDASLGTRAACVDGPSFKGVPRGRDAVELCGGCHGDPDAMFRFGLPTDQLLLYRRSHHGKRLYETGDANVPTCVTCHAAHDVRPVGDPESPAYRTRVPATCAACHADPERMAPYKLPTDVFEKYSKSAHGRGLIEGRHLRLPHCGDCHSSHGARPAGVKEVADMCGHCHVAAREHFKRSPHFRAAEAGKMEECTSCHGHHEIEPVGDFLADGWEPRGCSGCHEPGSAVPEGAAAAAAMSSSMDRLRRRIVAAADEIEHARGLGIVVASEEGFLNEARHALVMAGPVGHAASPEEFSLLAAKGEGIATKVSESLAVKVRRIRDRRLIATAFFAIVVAVAGAMLLKIARLRRRGAAVPAPGEGP